MYVARLVPSLLDVWGCAQDWMRIAERGKQLLQMLRDRGAGKSEVCHMTLRLK